MNSVITHRGLFTAFAALYGEIDEIDHDMVEAMDVDTHADWSEIERRVLAQCMDDMSDLEALNSVYDYPLDIKRDATKTHPVNAARGR